MTTILPPSHLCQYQHFSSQIVKFIIKFYALVRKLLIMAYYFIILINYFSILNCYSFLLFLRDGFKFLNFLTFLLIVSFIYFYLFLLGLVTHLQVVILKLYLGTFFAQLSNFIYQLCLFNFQLCPFSCQLRILLF